MPSVLNMRTIGGWSGLDRHPNAAYVGRLNRTPEHFGNPFTHLRTVAHDIVIVESRVIAVRMYEEWLDGLHPSVEPSRLAWVLQNMRPRLHGKDLACWCAPLACHAYILLVRTNP